MESLSKLTTESNNKLTADIDRMSPLEIAELMNREDRRTIQAVGEETESIAEAIGLIERAFRRGGRLLYFGCGTSGRLGVLDASECPPTFGTPPEMVAGVIAGGDTALRSAVENAEDDREAGEEAVRARGVGENDAVVGISASGRSPYVLGALSAARAAGAAVIGLCNNRRCEMASAADVLIAPEVGPEVIQGSTRLKAGTAQKMVLNMLTTGAMIRIGKVYRNLMVDMRPTNGKLFARAVGLVAESTACGEAEAREALEACDYHVKTAIVMREAGLGAGESRALLARHGGSVRRALEETARAGRAPEKPPRGGEEDSPSAM